ncbi:MAG: hypothetical protein KJ792_02770 [Actinobacteria bacterium]|nr:hypothetical protein [Actinomycetota bacterium]
MRRHRSVIFAEAASAWRECRDAYDLFLEDQHSQAERACRGNLLNRRGRTAGIRAETLFLGPWSRARAYASDELLEWWATHPRQTFSQFERSWSR